MSFQGVEFHQVTSRHSMNFIPLKIKYLNHRVTGSHLMIEAKNIRTNYTEITTKKSKCYDGIQPKHKTGDCSGC